MIFRILATLLFFIVSGTSTAAVWKDTNKWDRNWEKKYQEWVKANWTEEFFMDDKKPLYYKLEHDCADAVYLMRLIFSYEHKLPFVINNAHKRGKLITNKMRTWDKLPEDKRMRKFMDYVSDTTSTKTLRHDTYPIALHDLKPGDVYVAPGVHSYQIVNITETGVAEVMASTTPKAPRFLSRIASFPFYVPEDYKGKSDGYRRFIQPQNIRKSRQAQPGYNEEQYKIARDVKYNYVAFTDVISRRLGKRPELVPEKTMRLLIALCMYANDRSVYVYDALWHLQEIRKKGRQCMTRTEYDNYSTPSRDKRLRAFFSSVKIHLDSTWKKDSNSMPQVMAATIFRSKPPPPRETKMTNDFCMVQMSLGESYYMSLRDLRINLEKNKVISDPHAPLEYRWGIGNKPYKASCRAY
ncbi:MAG: Unknown protein [uncultured Thiotrichaceae bacterium]|uniref:JmjC domain-containing protein n=1 Tax=uncultured Thiotrichaceae bacterium TaxID=298394 RepID=A0A6S6UDW2_9GAMM|nr:MAG: Unknown protein [uncultured Thiotrichaceae bacterium]